MFNHQYRNLAVVERWGILPRIGRQSVAEHSFYVVMYCADLCRLFNVSTEETAYVLQQAIYHDEEERETGDINSPAKRMIVDRQELEDFKERSLALVGNEVAVVSAAASRDWDGHKIIKIADLIDECFFLANEIAMGSRRVDSLRDALIHRLYEAVAKVDPKKADQVVNAVEREMRLYINGDTIPVRKPEIFDRAELEKTGATDDIPF